MKRYCLVLVGLFWVGFSTFGQQGIDLAPASIRIFNPTKGNSTSVIEIPTGSLASPGLIDWNTVHLELSGQPIPFAIREGQAHWKASLTAPVKNPRPEDLLVFSSNTPAGKWDTVKIVSGALKSSSHLINRKDILTVSYPGFNVIIDKASGMLKSINAFEDSILHQSMRTKMFEVAEEVVTQHGSMNPGNIFPSLSLTNGKALSGMLAKLISTCSNAAYTELNFNLAYRNELAIALTYRIYSSAQLEVVIDERPWQDKSPWLKYRLENDVQLEGEKEALDAFQTYFPYYGFKDYATSVRSVGEYYKGKHTTTFVFGEESINGRFWKRKIKAVPQNEIKDETEIVDLLSEGMIIVPKAVGIKPPANINLTYKPDDSAIARQLIAGLLPAHVNVNQDRFSNSVFTIELKSEVSHDQMLKGDGYRIDPTTNGIRISAATRFGLNKAVAGFLSASTSATNSFVGSLVAANPVIDLRAGGFGGGPFEVDFPYGSENEWQQVLDAMMKSGMNAMTDLGMWSNWKMPVVFKYMPELMTQVRDAYDEVSGARFSEFDSCKKFATKLINYIHARGGKVWLWVPVGAIPQTFEEKFPDATVPGKKKVPQFMHPAYRRYLKSYFKELVETYPLDGFVLIRDDNGGIDDTEAFRRYLSGTKTKDRVWEQYFVLDSIIRDTRFRGTVAIYPYFDLYKPELEKFIPKDILILGHGSGMGTLTRSYETLGTMGDTWIDNLFTGFRIPSTGRMKRLLSDRGSYWIGGSYTLTELCWQAIGYFGWEPTASVNSFRYDFGISTFGAGAALDFVSFSEALDHLFEIMNDPLFPPRWWSLSMPAHDSLTKEAERWLVKFQESVSALEEKSTKEPQRVWIKHAKLYHTYFKYHLDRANLSSQLADKVLTHLNYYALRSVLPNAVRQEMIQLNQKIYDLSGQYDREMAMIPGSMFAASRAAGLTKPFRDFLYGDNGYPATVDQLLAIKQFAAEMKCTVPQLQANTPFDIRIDLKNKGFMPWVKELGFQVKIKHAEKTSLKDADDIVLEPMVFGDSLSVAIHGGTPAGHGTEKITVLLVTPFLEGRQAIAEETILLKW